MVNKEKESVQTVDKVYKIINFTQCQIIEYFWQNQYKNAHIELTERKLRVS